MLGLALAATTRARREGVTVREIAEEPRPQKAIPLPAHESTSSYERGFDGTEARHNSMHPARGLDVADVRRGHRYATRKPHELARFRGGSGR